VLKLHKEGLSYPLGRTLGLSKNTVMVLSSGHREYYLAPVCSEPNRGSEGTKM
jgi:hypothetical protein